MTKREFRQTLARLRRVDREEKLRQFACLGELSTRGLLGPLPSADAAARRQWAAAVKATLVKYGLDPRTGELA